MIFVGDISLIWLFFSGLVFLIIVILMSDSNVFLKAIAKFFAYLILFSIFAVPFLILNIKSAVTIMVFVIAIAAVVALITTFGNDKKDEIRQEIDDESENIIRIAKAPKVSIMGLENGNATAIKDGEERTFTLYKKIDFDGVEIKVKTRNIDKKLENAEVAIKGNAIFITMSKDSKIESLAVNNPKFGANGIIEADIDVKFGEETSSNAH